MPTHDDLLDRQEVLEGLVYSFIELFNSSQTGNSIFTGTLSEDGVEVNDAVEDLLVDAERVLDSSPIDFEEGDVEGD